MARPYSRASAPVVCGFSGYVAWRDALSMPVAVFFASQARFHAPWEPGGMPTSRKRVPDWRPRGLLGLIRVAGGADQAEQTVAV